MKLIECIKQAAIDDFFRGTKGPSADREIITRRAEARSSRNTEQRAADVTVQEQVRHTSNKDKSGRKVEALSSYFSRE